jgi:hypothetical protein
VDASLVLLTELVPLIFALRGFLLRRGFWHGYMQGTKRRDATFLDQRIKKSMS